jgi:hypothetical protein
VVLSSYCSIVVIWLCGLLSVLFLLGLHVVAFVFLFFFFFLDSFNFISEAGVLLCVGRIEWIFVTFDIGRFK